MARRQWDSKKHIILTLSVDWHTTKFINNTRYGECLMMLGEVIRSDSHLESVRLSFRVLESSEFTPSSAYLTGNQMKMRFHLLGDRHVCKQRCIIPASEQLHLLWGYVASSLPHQTKKYSFSSIISYSHLHMIAIIR